MSTSNLDHSAHRQGCVPPVCEVHLPNYLQEAAGVEQFPIGLLTCTGWPKKYTNIKHHHEIVSETVTGAIDSVINF